MSSDARRARFYPRYSVRNSVVLTRFAIEFFTILSGVSLTTYMSISCAAESERSTVAPVFGLIALAPQSWKSTVPYSGSYSGVGSGGSADLSITHSAVAPETLNGTATPTGGP